MLTWMTSYPEILKGLSRYITSRDFVTPFYRRVAEMVEEQYREGPGESGPDYQPI